MKRKFSNYDVADYLKSEEDMALYLEACFDEAGDDAAFISAARGSTGSPPRAPRSARSRAKSVPRCPRSSSTTTPWSCGAPPR